MSSRSVPLLARHLSILVILAIISVTGAPIPVFAIQPSKDNYDSPTSEYGRNVAKLGRDMAFSTGSIVGLTPSAFALPADLLGNISAISAGYHHTCALTTAGGVKCWGANGFGRLGDGTTSIRLGPVNVEGLTSGAQAIVAGGYHTCALTIGGGVKCWGLNADGQLGDGSTNNSSIPMNVIGITNGVQAISASPGHTCALTAAGGAKCWGQNDHGQLGDGTTVSRLVPVDVSGLTSGVRAIATGYKHTCALTIEGSVKCWGRNDVNQLGIYGVPESTIPVEVSGLPLGVQAIFAGQDYNCTLTTGGSVACWGLTPSNGRNTSPIHVIDGVQSLAAGANHTCALMSGGSVKCWGSNYTGQLGNGKTSFDISRLPSDVVGLANNVQAIAASGWGERVGYTCALTTSGSVKCWGDNGDGQLGNGTILNRNSPSDVSGLTSGVRAIAASGHGGYWTDTGSHSCALTTSGGVKCWGFNLDGQLGDGTSATRRYTPADVNGLTSGVQAIATGPDHTCALTTGGGIKCWGKNVSGQLGDNTYQDRPAPVDVIGLTSGVQAITAGGSEQDYYRWHIGHTCALTISGGVKCWGANRYGQLGDGTTDQRLAPVDVIGLSSGIQAIAAGGYHTCALTTAGGVKCWGLNDYGQLGDSTTISRTSPVDVRGLSSGVLSIATGLVHTCALTTEGRVKCWGANHSGQLGDGSGIYQQSTPVDVIGLTSGVQAISAGDGHSCAVTTAGNALCWGLDGTDDVEHRTAVTVSGLTGGVQAVAAGSSYTCVLTSTGGVKCWGDNYSGELGVNPGWEPVEVVDSAPPSADNAALDSKMVYPTVGPGTPLRLWINVRNSGTTTWTAAAGYGWRGTEQWQGQTESIPGSVGPNQIWYVTRDIIAPLQPGTYVYGFVLQHGGVDFGPHFFIQVSVDTSPDYRDSDGDGLLDVWETKGIDTDGDGVVSLGGAVDVNLPAMGADVNKKDVFVEVDWMPGKKPSLRAIKLIVDAFASAPVDGGKGINLHVDVGPDSVDYVTDKYWGPYGRGSEVDFQALIGSHTEEGKFATDFDAISTPNFQHDKRVFRYALFAHQFDDLTTQGPCHSGIALGQRLIVSLGCYKDGTDFEQAGTFMHELGHTLGLQHGGNDVENNKPNYLSVMNYSFQFGGLLKWKNGKLTEGNFDYSRVKLPAINEYQLSETAGIGAQGIQEVQNYGTRYWVKPLSKCLKQPIDDQILRVGDHINGPIDWNCNGTQDGLTSGGTVQADINGDRELDTQLTGYDDWTNLQYRRGYVGYGTAPATLVTTPEMLQDVPREMTPEDKAHIEVLDPNQPNEQKVFLPTVLSGNR